MKNPFKFNPMVSKVLQQYKKETEYAIDRTRTALHQIDDRMQTIRRYGKRAYVERDNDTIDDIYGTIKDARYITSTHAEDIAYTIHQAITDIEDGIKQINKSDAISIFITKDEKSELITTLTGLIDKLNRYQAKIDAARMEVYTYTESVLQRIHKESSHIMFVYDSEKKEWNIMMGSNQETELKRLEPEFVASESTEESSEESKENEEPGFEETKDGNMLG